MALPEKSSQLVTILSTIYIQMSLGVWFPLSAVKYKPGETFVVTLGPFKGRWKLAMNDTICCLYHKECGVNV